MPVTRQNQHRCLMSNVNTICNHGITPFTSPSFSCGTSFSVVVVTLYLTLGCHTSASNLLLKEPHHPLIICPPVLHFLGLMPTFLPKILRNLSQLQAIQAAGLGVEGKKWPTDVTSIIWLRAQATRRRCRTVPVRSHRSQFCNNFVDQPQAHITFT